VVVPCKTAVEAVFRIAKTFGTPTGDWFQALPLYKPGFPPVFPETLPPAIGEHLGEHGLDLFRALCDMVPGSRLRFAAAKEHRYFAAAAPAAPATLLAQVPDPIWDVVAARAQLAEQGYTVVPAIVPQSIVDDAVSGIRGRVRLLVEGQANPNNNYGQKQ
jgi:hypothetical protein